MTHLPWFERTSRCLKLLSTLLAMTLLASCGSSKKYEEFIPTRILSIGDAMSYMDLTGAAAVNSLTSIDPNTGSTDHWLWVYAAAYGLTNKGGPNSGGNVLFFNNDPAQVPDSADLTRDTLGKYAAISTQANSLPPPQSGDLVVISIGMGDIFARAQTLEAGPTAATTTDIDALKNIGLAYANLADSIYQRGFKHVLIVPAVDYSSSPYAASLSATYRSNLGVLTEALNFGVNHNCNGGCASLLDSKPYPTRSEGVWKFASYEFMLNIVRRNPASVQFDMDTTLPTNPRTDLYNLGNPNLPYYYSTELFPTPALHRLVGTYLYNMSRSYAGF